MRRRSIVTTWIVAPCASMPSPTTASRPGVCMTNPAIVSDAPWQNAVRSLDGLEADHGTGIAAS